ncbi:MAG: 2-oxoacid:ferredoxin oxidoreductase subunit beta [Erysipelotrichaceae bacterium]|nr:2-oxoacid:ferredoxin oxidoreductase subunit beta [Erysipelotrichaceae bacterium]
MKDNLYEKYLVDSAMPTMWCPGCGNGIVLQSIIRAVDELGLDQDRTVFVSGIGCSSRAVNYLNFDCMHTNHGRAIAFATGIKMSDPDLKVIVLTGDGDCASIGGNHLIHACRRNIDLTVICMNNSNYGMTGGQFSPTTPLGSQTKTSVYGSYEPPFDLCELTASAGATYVARAATYLPVQMKEMIKKAIMHHGLSFVDCASDCPSLFGRLNRRGDAGQMMLGWKDRLVSVKQAETMSREDLEGKVVWGEFVNSSERIEYTDVYRQNIARAKESVNG